ncbi:FecR family protein [Daejeonella sp.]|uniref:FecR family protein n=1 Tax=Daejeonella sp. TaxID=2805397 RepID=UPI00273194E3|nr:FecR family protein [Daejeonella sp.]MDP2413750.1 FecR domain-containing protein [Daejeonella sp.]
MNFSNSRTTYLFSKYYDRTASQKEIKELFDILKSSSDQELTKLMRDEWENFQHMEAPFFSFEKSQEMLDKILASGRDKNKFHEEVPAVISRRKPLIFISISAAAALIIINIIGFDFWSEKITPASVQIVSAKVNTDLSPGGNRAVLTFENGQRIILDSINNGIIAKNESFEIIKTENGQLVYHAFDRNYKNARNGDFNVVSTPRGGGYRITLPDGSKVWLNAASSIKFPGVFKRNIREVELDGEAYFEIVKKSAMPFMVRSGRTEIEVLGTHFNVKAYSKEKIMKTTLVEGSVKINEGNSSLLLKPGQQVRLTGGNLTILNNVDIEEQIAWKNGLFIFKDASIEEVMSQVASWYDLNVTFEGKVPKKYLTGKVSRNVNALEFMNLLNYAGVKFKITGKNIVIMNK